MESTQSVFQSHPSLKSSELLESLPLEIYLMIFKRCVTDFIGIAKLKLVSKQFLYITENLIKEFCVTSFFEDKIPLSLAQKLDLISQGYHEIELSTKEFNEHFSRLTCISTLKKLKTFSEFQNFNCKNFGIQVFSYISNLTSLDTLSLAKSCEISHLGYLTELALKDLGINLGHNELPPSWPNNFSLLTSFKISFEGSVRMANKPNRLTDRGQTNFSILTNLTQLNELTIDSDFAEKYELDWRGYKLLTKLNCRITLKNPEQLTILTALKTLKICEPLEDFSFTHFTHFNRLEKVTIFRLPCERVLSLDQKIIFPKSMKAIKIEASCANYSFDNLDGLEELDCLGDIVDEGIAKLTNLRILKISGPKLFYQFFKKIPDALFPLLSEFSLEEFDFQFPLETLTYLQELKVFKLERRGKIQYPSCLTQLQELVLSNQSEINFSSLSSHNSKLTSLQVRGERTRELEKINHLKELKFLSLNLKQDDVYSKHLSTALTKLKLLKINSDLSVKF